MDEARVQAIAEQIADRKAKDAEEQAYRRAQSKFDKDLAHLRERQKQSEQGLAAFLADAGLDPEKVRAYQQSRTQAEELEALRDRASRADAYEQLQQAQAYRDQAVRAACEATGLAPNDPRLDLSSPEAFNLSVLRAVREDAEKKAKPPAPPANNDGEEPIGGNDEGEEGEVQGKPKTRKRPATVDVLGGGSAPVADPEREYQDKLKALRGTGRVAEALALMREYEAKRKKK